MSRVAVHIPPGHPHHGGGEQTDVVAYRLGRIRDGIDNFNVATGETTPVDDLAAGLADQARAEYPDCEVKLERLVDNGDGTSRWIPADEFDAEQHTPAPGGGSAARTFTATAGQEA